MYAKQVKQDPDKIRTFFDQAAFNCNIKIALNPIIENKVKTK